MEIKYDENGRILSCSAVEGVEQGKRILKVSDSELPEDFLATFALGKYVVRKGKIVRVKGFVPPETTEQDLLKLFTRITPKGKSNSKD